MKIGIIGYGVVGQAINNLFQGIVDVGVYDKHKTLTFNETLEDAEVVFICVPTNICDSLNPDGGLFMGNVYEAVSNIQTSSIIVICSTMNVGTADILAKKFKCRIVVQPEYLGESPGHPFKDLHDASFIILGGDKEDVDIVRELYQKIYNATIKIRHVTRKEAEIIKLSENRAIAFKIAQCQELYDVCKKAGVDYYTIREAVYGDDLRFNLWFTNVYEKQRGFLSKCLPKDVYSWKHWSLQNNYFPRLTESVLTYNESLLKTRGD
jgi:UDPglucose 6-dehydrogenase